MKAVSTCFDSVGNSGMQRQIPITEKNMTGIEREDESLSRKGEDLLFLGIWSE